MPDKGQAANRSAPSTDLAPGVAGALGTLTGWERRLFRSLVEQAAWDATNVERTKAVVAGTGFVRLVHIRVAHQVGLVGGAVAWAAVSVESVAVVGQYGWLWVVEAGVLLAAAGIACWALHRRSTAKAARTNFAWNHWVQPDLGPGEGTRPRATLPADWARVGLAADMFVIGVAALNARYSAPRALGAFALAMSWLVAASALWSRAPREVPGLAGRRPSRAAAQAATRARTATVLAMSAVFAIALVSVQATVGKVLAARAPTSTASGPATTSPGLVNAYQEICVTLLETGLAGLAKGQGASGLVDAFDMTVRQMMENPSAGIGWFRAEAERYMRQIKSVGPANAKAEMRAAVVAGCTVLVAEGFVPHP